MKKGTGTEAVRVIPLGGLEEIGMNMTAFEYKDSIIVVDCGLSFPSDEMLGIDLVLPDTMQEEKENIRKMLEESLESAGKQNITLKITFDPEPEM